MNLEEMLIHLSDIGNTHLYMSNADGDWVCSCQVAGVKIISDESITPYDAARHCLEKAKAIAAMFRELFA